MENKKEIEAIQITFENCVGITIPYKCVTQLDYKTKKYAGECGKDSNINGIITNLDCIIENNGSIIYDADYMEDGSSPIQRLSQYNDICYFDIIYKDGTRESNYVKWYYKNNYDDPQENKNQTSELLRYNKIHIHVEPYIPQYTIFEIFAFPPRTTFKDEENNKYEIQLNSSGKYIDMPMTEKYINMKYTVDKKEG